MTVLVSYGDRLLTRGGQETAMKRPSVPFSTYGGTGLAVADGRVVSYQNLYETQPWVAVNINKLNRQIVRLPLTVHRWVGDDGESEPVRDHPLTALLNRPYGQASSATLKQKAAFPTLLHGNGLLWKRRETTGAPPGKLTPLDWRFLVPYCSEDGRVLFWEWVVGDRREFIDPQEVVHFAWESGVGDLGVAPLRQLGVTLRAEDATQRYQSASFENGVRPSGAYTLPIDAGLDKDERDELRAEIRGQHGGDNNHGVMLLSGGATWQSHSHTAVEAELIEQRKLNREEVAAVYDVDPPMIGILDHATYSNVGEMHRMLYGPTLGPWLALIADTLNAQLVDAESRWQDERLFVGFDLTEVLRSNTLEEIRAIQLAIATGVMTPNEGRARLRLRKSDDEAADRLYMPVNNMQPLGTTPDEPSMYADTVKAHMGRAIDRIARKMSAGQPPWDRDRFVRELVEDQPDASADELADTLQDFVDAAGMNAAEFRRLTEHL